MADINEKFRKVVRNGFEIELKALLRDPECNALGKDIYGTTALMLAAIGKCEACLEILLPVSDGLAKDDIGITALMWAARNGNEVCVGMLLPVSDPLDKDYNGMTALMHAAMYGKDACVEVLLPVSDASAKNAAGRTASNVARLRTHEGLAQFIDGYVLAQGERAVIDIALCPVASQRKASRRV